MLAVKDWLNSSATKLNNVGITTFQLDAEVILANCLNKDRTYLHAHPEFEIDKAITKKADKMIGLRINRMPIAYITGYKEFYGRQFNVTKDTLIPRPESEMVIEMLKSIVVNNSTDKTLSLVDVGTGSGCLGVTAKLEIPELDVLLLDISNKALEIAEINANKLLAEVRIVQSNLLNTLDQKTDIIIANLPYVDKTWDRSPETDYEPPSALFADNAGKYLIEELIIQAQSKLTDGGYVIIESDPSQHSDLIQFAKDKSFKLFMQQDYIIGFIYSN